jgi:hypothetical protein
VFNENRRRLFDCETCGDDQKEKRGCGVDVDHVTQNIGCVCGGSKNCKLCEGSGQIELSRCPASFGSSALSMLPYFFAWRDTKTYPDGQALYFQPVKLIEAINILNSIYGKIEIDRMQMNNRK